MRRLLILIGILLIPSGASAAALSPWVQAVLERADTEMSSDGAVVPACDHIAETVTNRNLIVDSLGTTVDLAIESQFLRERTICAESDRSLLLEKRQEIQEAMNDALVSPCSPEKLAALRAAYAFITDAYRSFLYGSIDPSYKDTILLAKDEDAPLCPYTTDYSPHAIGYIPATAGGAVSGGGSSFDLKSYGCDLKVLQDIQNNLPEALKKEAENEIKFQSKAQEIAVDLYSLISQSLSAIDRSIAMLSGVPPPPAPPSTVTPPSHDKAVGCLRPPSPEAATADAGQIDDLLTAYPDYFSADNLRKDSAGNMTYSPPRSETLPEGVIFTTTTNPFSFLPNAVSLNRLFTDHALFVGLSRPLPLSYLEESLDMFSLVARTLNAAKMLRLISGNIQQETAFFEAAVRDPYERIADVTQPLSAAVNSLADLTQNFLPKEYIPNVVYFLLRSCVDGHCKGTLEAVAQRSFNKYCHPYVSGDYTDEEAVKKCFCEDQYKNEDFCMGQSSMQQQKPQLLMCGEPETSIFKK